MKMTVEQIASAIRFAKRQSGEGRALRIEQNALIACANLAVEIHRHLTHNRSDPMYPGCPCSLCASMRVIREAVDGPGVWKEGGLLDVIRSVQWSANNHDCKGPRCPYCGHTQSSGHSQGCIVRAALEGK